MKKIPLMFRNDSFYVVRRVPARYASVEPRKQIWLSLDTAHHVEATNKASAAWDALVEFWELRLAGRDEDAMKRYDAAREIAARKGFTFLPKSEVRQLPDDALLERVEAIPNAGNLPGKEEGVALLGNLTKPRLTVSSALDEFWKLSKGDYLNLDQQQIRKKKNPVLQANRDFIAAVGDIALDDLKRDMSCCRFCGQQVKLAWRGLRTPWG